MGNYGLNKEKNMPIITEQDLMDISQPTGRFLTENDIVDVAPATKAKTSKKMSLGEQALDVLGGALEVPAVVATGAVAGGLGLLGGIAKTFTSGDVEGKKTREDIMNYFTYKPQTESGRGAMNVIGDVLSPLSIPRDIATSAGEQWGNLADTATIGLLPKVPKAIKTARNVPSEIGQWLYGKQLYPSPKRTFAESKAIVETGFKKGYDITDKGMELFKRDLDEIGRKKSQLLADKEGLFVDFSEIIEPLNRLGSYAGKTSTPIRNRKTVEGIKAQLEKEWLSKYPDGKIPLDEVQSFKETLYKRNEASFGELKKAMSPEIEKAIASGARKGIEDMLPELGVINRNFKPLLEFYDSFESAVKRVKYEHFSWTDTVFNNQYLMTKLIQVMRIADKIIGTGKPVKPNMPSAAIRAGMQKEYPVDFEEGTKGLKATPDYNPEQIEYKPTINLGMESISGKPLPKNFTSFAEFSHYMKDRSPELSTPEFWAKNQDAVNILLKQKHRGIITEPEYNSLLMRIRLNNMGGKINPPRDVQTRFNSDASMKGNKLGKQTDNGIEVYDNQGKLRGYYK